MYVFDCIPYEGGASLTCLRACACVCHAFLRVLISVFLSHLSVCLSLCISISLSLADCVSLALLIGPLVKAENLLLCDKYPRLPLWSAASVRNSLILSVSTVGCS